MRRLFLSFLTFALAVGCCSEPIEKYNASNIVLPIPNTVVAVGGTLSIGSEVSITYTGYEENSSIFEAELSDKFGITAGKGKSINIIVDGNVGVAAEGYILDVNKKGVTITASDMSGAYYGTQTLIQMMDAGREEGKVTLGYQTIQDAPRFGYRAYMLDEARHFFGEEEVLRIIDAMASVKMNVLHWHLTDDSGWRIESKIYPLLTEIGSKRSDTEKGSWGSGQTYGVPHEGFYTQEQIKSIVHYAKARGIKVIPEIEMPGHASASVAAYPWLSTKNEKIEVPVKFGKHYFTYDVINPKVIEFLENVIVEMIDLFETDVVHIGGDEVRFDHWEQDRDMIAHKKKQGYSSFMDIQIEFTNKMSKFIESKGVSMMGWNEILGKQLHHGEISFDDTSSKLASNVIVQFWKGSLSDLAEAAADGYKIVNSYNYATYLDYSYNTVSLKTAYNYNPIPEGLDEQFHKNIYGLSCQMWTEWTPTIADVHRQSFPRLAAYAEVGWSSQEGKDYDAFVSRLQPVLATWAEAGIEGYSLDKLLEEEVAAEERKAAGNQRPPRREE